MTLKLIFIDIDNLGFANILIYAILKLRKQQYKHQQYQVKNNCRFTHNLKNLKNVLAFCIAKVL